MNTTIRNTIIALIAAGSFAAVSVAPAAAAPASAAKAGSKIDLVIGPITVEHLVCKESSTMGVMECTWVPS